MDRQERGDTRDWASIRHAYENGDGTIKQICERFGVTKGSLEHRQRVDRWIPRLTTNANNQSVLLARLFAVLEAQVTKLSNTKGETLGDKEANQLSEMIKNFDKLSTIEAADTSKGGPAQKKDMRDLRDKLAKRIAQFKRR
ncbi:hypothetical protein [Devosia sp. SL43]|uniref:hypothetical protein n=1 Tax=Devosia sp. SL43 TaxID=2806348 RepID=UPI001F38932A|nr:hypothetical protein [Devosia sp. SL43]UJW85510.1 hypothetical protein IM737_19280 [Devosia sp. SL43]